MYPIELSILSVAPGRGRLGVAVSRRGQLVYYGVKSLRQFRSEAEIQKGLEKILAKLVIKYGISKLLAPELNKQQSHSAAVVFVDRCIEDLATRQQVTLQRYDPLAVRRTLCNDLKPTKDATSETLVGIYPELRRYRRGESEWERRYYGYLFSAAAAIKASDVDQQTAKKSSSSINSSHRQKERIL